MTQNANRASRGWGANPPDWIVVLARECDKTSQSKVAKDLGVSSPAVNQVLGNSYHGRVDRIENLVRGTYMKATVACPVLGEISTVDCADNQRQTKKFKATNHLRVLLANACPVCPHREKEKPCEDSKKGKA